MAVWSQVKVCGRRLNLWPVGYARSVRDTKAPLQLQYAACGARLVLYAFVFDDPMIKHAIVSK